MAVGGDITEITYNHPTLGAGIVFPKSGEDTTWNLGGFRSNDDNQMVDGSGAMIDQMNRSRWFVESTVSWAMNDRQELEKLVALAESPVPADWTFSHVNGTVYGAKGKPVGDMDSNANQATFTLKVAGGGKLKKISG
jgi:hypothetical protein